MSLRAASAHRPTLDVIEAKLRRPLPRPGDVPRSALVNSLRRDPPAVVSVVAGAGYGKTTLLAQWSAAESRSVAWVSIDARDNDPLVLLKHVVAAVDRIEPLDRRLAASFAPGRTATSASAVDRAPRALAALRRPFLLVLDNADLLRTSPARRVMSMLIVHAPEGSTVALASRAAPNLSAAALRACGNVRDVGVAELSFNSREAQLLLRRTNPALRDEEAADLIAVCEGWPAALSLAALSRASLSLQDDTRRASRFGGNDRYVADYIRSEVLSRLHPRDVCFLRRASILDELTGPLCVEVVKDAGSDSKLKELARTNLVVVPLEGRPGWYRFHRLIRDLLARELVDEDPELVPTLHLRAADWYEDAGQPQAALKHANLSGDADRIAAIVDAVALPALCRGRVLNVERSLTHFDGTGELEEHPAVALHGSLIHAFRGHAADAERYLGAAERGGRRRRGREAVALRPRLAVVRAALCRAGARQMLADAGAALRGLPAGSDWYPVALHMRATAGVLLGAADEAPTLLDEAARAADAVGYAQTRMIALSQLSLLARQHDHLDGADAAAAAAREIARTELDGHPTAAIALAAAAQTSLRRGNWAEARELVEAAAPVRAHVTEALPWLALTMRLALARCYVTLRDVEGARDVVGEIDAILDARPRLGVLVEEARALRHEVRALAGLRGAPAGMTPAELRLLPLLATHLSFREIAERLKVSHNTVKTQAISIYRKLGVSGRSEAIAAAADLPSRRAAA